MYISSVKPEFKTHFQTKICEYLKFFLTLRQKSGIPL
jgi:hypothetical protein